MITGIIPARYASSRFPGKPLADIEGKPMIQRVFEQAQLSQILDKVIIATDHEGIRDTCLDFTSNVIITSPDHENGTERCAEVAQKIHSDYYLNIQGDEPFIDPKQIDLVCQALVNGAGIATLKKSISEPQLIQDPNVVKVICDRHDKALYFSRSPLPHQRDAPIEEWGFSFQYFKHIGLYGFAKNVLAEIVSLPHSPLEIAESLEQLRWLENGYEIQVKETDVESIGIDVPEDILRALRIFRP